MAMKDDSAFLYPPPRIVRRGGGALDIGRVCFPLEIFKKFDFLFERFSVRNRSQGLEVIFQEQSGLGAEEYAIECGSGRVVLSAATPRGQFYALSTLLQVLACHEGSGRMPSFSLRDSPQVPFRGFLLPLEAEIAPPPAGLRGLLVKLGLLRFNHLALPAGAAGGEDLAALTGLARRAGMEIMLLDGDPRTVFRFEASGRGGRSLPEEPLFFKSAGEGGNTGASGWLDFVIDQHRAAKARGKRTAVWADVFSSQPQWVRKLPQDVLVLNREAAPERAMPFRRHHIRQALCPVLCDRGRLIPDARSGLARAVAALAAARAWKLDGVMACGGESGSLCLLDGAAMALFQTGCLLWSGRLPQPPAFSRWALGRDEPDLFRVYSFLAQAEHRLPFPHSRYLFEDPLTAPYSRQGDPREVVAHFRKAAQYLGKREMAAIELTPFIGFARRLYEFIAAKVEFSGRLGQLLGGTGSGEETGFLAAGLERSLRELQQLFQGLLGATGAAARPSLGEFGRLGDRLAALQRQSSSPSGRAALLRELRDGATEDL